MEQILEKYEYAFIHIPKNAGMSMCKAIKNIPIIKPFNHFVLFDNIKNLKEIIIIRHPLDRFSSAFFYVKKHYVKDLYDNPNELIEDILNSNDKANKFLKFHKHYHTVNGQRIDTDWVFHPQTAWVNNPFRVLLFEKLNEDIEKLNDDLQINISLPYINAAERTDFEYFPDSIEYLHIRYKDDFEYYDQLLINRQLT